MAEDDEEAWLSAQAALRFVAAKYRHDDDAKAALVEAAARGVIRTKCVRSLVQIEDAPDQEFADCGVRPSFWRTLSGFVGNEHSDWLAGDFTAKSKRPDGRLERTQLTGAQFDEGGVTAKFGAMAEVIRRPKPPPPASDARSLEPRGHDPRDEVSPQSEGISPDEYRGWYPPTAAIEALKAVGFDGPSIRPTILYRVTAGDLRAVAEKIIERRSGYRDQTHALKVVEPESWVTTGVGSVFWHSGDIVLSFRRDGRGSQITYACTAIRFDPAGLEKLAQQKRPSEGLGRTPPPANAPEPSRRGPKPREYWEPMWAAMAARFARPEADSMTEAEIARAMSDWLAENDHYPVDSTVRIRAELLVKALKSKRR